MTARYTARSWALLTSIVVVVGAVLALLITGSPDSDPAVAATPPSSSRSPSPSAAPATPETTPKPKPTPRPKQKPDAKPEPEPKAGKERARPEPSPRPSAYVEVYNNSGVTGLAAETASGLSAAGWQVVSTDNWYGDIPATTVYYPARLKAQASLLAEEVGATRTRPAVEPMRFDRLTLILTGDL